MRLAQHIVVGYLNKNQRYIEKLPTIILNEIIADNKWISQEF
jgi:hypothetical protein